MEKLAGMITNAIQRNNSQLTDLQVRSIKYGLECLLGELSKFVIYFILFYAFSLTAPYMVALIFFCTIRIFAGGYHAVTYWKCFFTTLIIFSISIIVGQYVILHMGVKLIMLLIAIILAWIYAPVDHPNKPIISPIRRKGFKYLSVISFIMMGWIGLVLPSKLSITASAAIFLEALSLPIGRFLEGGEEL